jgi:hypothetical protein
MHHHSDTWIRTTDRITNQSIYRNSMEECTDRGSLLLARENNNGIEQSIVALRAKMEFEMSRSIREVLVAGPKDWWHGMLSEIEMFGLSASDGQLSVAIDVHSGSHQ